MEFIKIIYEYFQMHLGIFNVNKLINKNMHFNLLI